MYHRAGRRLTDTFRSRDTIVTVKQRNPYYSKGKDQTLDKAVYQIAYTDGILHDRPETAAVHAFPIYACVLLDIGLPGISGLDAISIISSYYPGVKILVISGMEDPLVAWQAMMNGANGFLLKPFRLSEMQKQIEYQ